MRLIRIYAGTGRRRREILESTHQDIDLERGIYRFINVKSRDKHKVTQRIPEDVLEDFKYFTQKHKDQINPFKIYVHEDTISDKIGELLTKAGYPELTLHSLRHTYCSILEEKGLNAREIQFIMDHSTILVTEGYLHTQLESSPCIGI